MNRIPQYQNLNDYNVNREGWEAIRQTLYDYQAYAAAGVTQLTYFALPVGQGGKTLSDTNMSLAGQLPANQEFLIQSIEVHFLPTVPTVAADNPASQGVKAVANIVNDAYRFYRTGNLKLEIGSKPYLQEAPLGRFPGKTYFQVNAATALAGEVVDANSRIAFAYAAGRPYLMAGAGLRLVSTQNFTITLNWPEGVQAIVNPARVGVILDGILYRRSQ